jgi:hypothetical protein
MRFLTVAAHIAAAVPAVASAQDKLPDVRVAQGNLVYLAADGQPRRLLADGQATDPVLSPDGSTVAFIHYDTKEMKDSTSLWLITVADGKIRSLFKSEPNDEPKRNMGTFDNPRFSLDGGYVYVDATAWTTSSAVHQINVKTGQERFVTAGWNNGIIREGPYRGYLLVGQHRYFQKPEPGSYNPVFVVRPDGEETMMVPGSDRDDGETSVAAWLEANGWSAW